jgi:hypothetical protein
VTDSSVGNRVARAIVSTSLDARSPAAGSHR